MMHFLRVCVRSFTFVDHCMRILTHGCGISRLTLKNFELILSLPPIASYRLLVPKLVCVHSFFLAHPLPNNSLYILKQRVIYQPGNNRLVSMALPLLCFLKRRRRAMSRNSDSYEFSTFVKKKNGSTRSDGQ